MKDKQNDVIITGEHLHIRDDLRQWVDEKMAKLFEHENRIIRIRVDIEHDKSLPAGQFVAKGHIEIKGPTLIAQANADNPEAAVDELSTKLQRMLRRRSRLRRVKRKNKQEIDLPAAIPKAI